MLGSKDQVIELAKEVCAFHYERSSDFFPSMEKQEESG